MTPKFPPAPKNETLKQYFVRKKAEQWWIDCVTNLGKQRVAHGLTPVRREG